MIGIAINLGLVILIILGIRWTILKFTKNN